MLRCNNSNVRQTEMGKQKAPSADPRIGEAAVMSAELGGDYLAWMQDQAKISNAWADEDRGRDISVFRPLQDNFIEEAQNYDTPAARERAAAEARGDASAAINQAREATLRNNARMGVDPRSGRAQAGGSADAISHGLALAGTSNLARRQTESEGRSLRANAVNLGSGFAVNPATSLGLANSSGSSGFSGAMQGQQQMGSLLNTQYQQQMATHNANSAASSSLFGGLGSIAGLGLSMMSSKDVKESKKPARGVLEALESMPVEQWKYKDGVEDGGEHIGVYAEDFQKATGKGDGKSIPVVDAIGVTMGAVQELSAKVDKLTDSMPPVKLKKPKSRGIGVAA